VSRKWKIFWTVAALCTAGSVALIFIASRTAPPTSSSTFIEVTKTLFLCLGGIGVLLPLTLNAMNAVEQRESDKIENTFDLLGKWDDSHLLAARNYTRKIRKLKSSICDDDLVKQIQESEELEQSVILVTNYFDHVRYSIKSNRIDVKAFKESLGSTVISIIDRFWPYYMLQSQETRNDLNELKNMLK